MALSHNDINSVLGNLRNDGILNDRKRTSQRRLSQNDIANVVEGLDREGVINSSRKHVDPIPVLKDSGRKQSVKNALNYYSDRQKDNLSALRRSNSPAAQNN